MNPAVIVVLALATAASARADCPITGKPIFEIDHLTEGSRASSIVKLYASGALTSEETTPEGKPGARTTSCLEIYTERLCITRATAGRLVESLDATSETHLLEIERLLRDQRAR